MDEVEEYLKFECRKCAEAREKCGKIICHLDGKEKADTDTCSYWRECQ